MLVSSLSISLSHLPLQAVWTQIRTDKMSVLILIQTIWHTDSVPERIVWKCIFEKISRWTWNINTCFPKIRKKITKFVVCCSHNWQFKGKLSWGFYLLLNWNQIEMSLLLDKGQDSIGLQKAPWTLSDVARWCQSFDHGVCDCLPKVV